MIVTLDMNNLKIGGPDKKLTSYHHWKNLGRVQRREEMPVHMSYQPPRILVGIHLERTKCAPPGRTLSWNDWPETWKQIPSPENPRLWATWQSGSPGLLTLTLSSWAPLPNEVSCFVSMCVSQDNSFPSVRQEPILRPWKGFQFL